MRKPLPIATLFSLLFLSPWMPLAVAAAAPAAPAAGSSAPVAPAPAATAPAAAAATPAAGGAVDRGPVAVPRADARILSYYRTTEISYAGRYITAVFTSALVLFTGFSARMRAFARRVGRFWVPMVAIYLVIFALIDFVCSLPFGIYNHFRDRAFGLTGESLGQWVIGDAKTLPAGILFIALLMMAFYGVVRFSPRRWWLYIAVVVFAIEVTSDWRDFLTAPKSKHLVPVQDQALAADLQSLAARAGVPSPELLQTMKGSELKTGASVASWNARPRVVIADPAVSKLSREQVIYTVARQLGEFRLRQHLKYSLIVALLSIVSFYLLYRTGTALIDRYRERFGFERLSDVASWPLFPALFNVFFLLVQPIDAASSRHFRHEADRFGLELAQDNRACAESFIALDSGKLLNPSPGPIHKLWRSFDPSLAERVEFCNTYRPWEQGGPLRYGAMFAEARHSQKTEP